MIELHDHRIKRLKMRSMRRGIKEMDLILGHFSETALDQMNEEELVNYDLLLAENDHDLYSWVTGSAAAPAEFVPMIDQIVAGLQVPRG